jgi:hypothetical protein
LFWEKKYRWLVADKPSEQGCFFAENFQKHAYAFQNVVNAMDSNALLEFTTHTKPVVFSFQLVTFA